jgi:hypothetical protein
MTPATPNTLQAQRIFISYPRGGLAHTWAECVQADLQQRGATPWRDETGVPQGSSDWYDGIETALRQADAVICVVGTESQACRWQKREMLLADDLGLPVVPLRTAPVALPWYAIEKQPVECRAHQADTLQALAHALAEQLALRARTSSHTLASAPSGPKPAQRQRELAYLNDLLNGVLSTHEARYEPVAGQEQRARSLERSHKGLGRSLRIDTGMLLRAFKQPSSDAMQHEGAVTHHADVLDAFTALPGHRVRRLAVLGEPGAGKSFALERVAVSFARRALQDPTAPVPLLARLGLWTREADHLAGCIASQIGPLTEQDLENLRNQGRAVLLLDGLNEIPPSQRSLKAEQVRRLAEDERWAAVLLSCRERDFAADFALPFDRLTLQPLTPVQVHRFLHRAYRLNAEDKAADQARAAENAEVRYWELAGGPAVRDAWQAWRAAGASLDLFWSADTVPTEAPNVIRQTSRGQDQTWREARANPRSLLKLAANPYALTVMAWLPTVPRNRAELFQGFLQVLHKREQVACEARHDARSVPVFEVWLDVLTKVAVGMQAQGEGHAEPGDVATALSGADWPAELTEGLLAFSQDASVLQALCTGPKAQVRFTHQLLQEALASRMFIEASRSPNVSASTFWPRASWWQRNGWEVVAELAAEHCTSEPSTLWALLGWLANSQPEVAASAWQRAGTPTLPPDLAEQLRKIWLPRLTAWDDEPSPLARAAIGRALAAFNLDDRPGVGLSASGMPDIDWVTIPGGQPFIYKGRPHAPLPSFQIARYPITHRQFKVFVEGGGYAESRWWPGGMEKIEPAAPKWGDANAPRETVCWHEAMAFCAWLSNAMQEPIRLPTKSQWERAASGTSGLRYPWGKNYRPGWANCHESQRDDSGADPCLRRTSAVGIYPGHSAEGVFDLAGNLWEWIADPHLPGDRDANAKRVLRGGSWDSLPRDLGAASHVHPGLRSGKIGFRVCRSSPICTQAIGAAER